MDPTSKAEDEGPGGPCWVALVTGQVLVFGGGTSSGIAWENRVVGLKKLEATPGIGFCFFLTDGWILLFFCDPQSDSKVLCLMQEGGQ